MSCQSLMRHSRCTGKCSLLPLTSDLHTLLPVTLVFSFFQVIVHLSIVTHCCCCEQFLLLNDCWFWFFVFLSGFSRSGQVESELMQHLKGQSQVKTTKDQTVKEFHISLDQAGLSLSTADSPSITVLSLNNTL